MSVLTQQEEKQRRGHAIDWALLFLASLAIVTEQDLIVAAAFWRRLAPVAGKGLVGARPMNTPASAFNVPRTPSVYRWNQDLLRYVGPDGRTISPKAAKQAVNTFVDRAGDELKQYTGRMTRGDITIEEWQQGMASRVKSIHVAADTIAQGGAAQVTKQDVTRMTEGAEFQLRRLLDFSESLNDLSSFSVTAPVSTVSDDAAINRAKQYANSARVRYEASIAQSWFDLAATGVKVEQLNVLSEEVDHCGPSKKLGTPGCLEETERGWVPIGSLSLPGERSCLWNCYCRMAFRRKPPNLN